MSSIAKTSISLSKKDLDRSRFPVQGSRNITFYHKASFGSTNINLLSLTMPSSEMPNMTQITIDEINASKLYYNRKNFRLVSASKGELIQGIDYEVTSSTDILLKGIYSLGTESGEIFIGTIYNSPVSDLVVASAKSITKTYTLPIGQSNLNLGKEYQVGVNPNENVGVIKVFVNGSLVQRTLDYTEVDSGSGYGSTIQFTSSPSSSAWKVAVDFGVMSITDNNAIGTIENLSGSIKKLSDGLSALTGASSSGYYAASPSDVERRTFGDTVLSLSAIPATIAVSALNIDWGAGNLFSKTIASSGTYTFTFSNNVDGKTIVFRIINSSAGALTLSWPASVLGPVTSLTASKTGIYTFIQFGTNVYMTSVEV